METKFEHESSKQQRKMVVKSAMEPILILDHVTNLHAQKIVNGTTLGLGAIVTRIVVEAPSHVLVRFSKKQKVVENHALVIQRRNENVMKHHVQLTVCGMNLGNGAIVLKNAMEEHKRG
jgi:hypothetical protein